MVTPWYCNIVIFRLHSRCRVSTLLYFSGVHRGLRIANALEDFRGNLSKIIMYQKSLYFLWFTVHIFTHHIIRAESIKTNGKFVFKVFYISFVSACFFLWLVAITSHQSFRSSSLLDLKPEPTFRRQINRITRAAAEVWKLFIAPETVS